MVLVLQFRWRIDNERQKSAEGKNQIPKDMGMASNFVFHCCRNNNREVVNLRNNIFNIREYYRKLIAEHKIIEDGQHFNRKDNSIDIDFIVNDVLITLKKYVSDRTEIRCFCKYHCLVNGTKPQAWCRTKSVLVYYLINQCSKLLINKSNKEG